MQIKKYEFSLNKKDFSIEMFMKRFHLEASDYERIYATHYFLSEVITIKMGIQFFENRIICVVSLGKEFDQLEEVVENSKQLMLSYCMECLGMEYLTQAYRRMNEIVQEETGMWVGNFTFFDEEKLEDISEILMEFKDFSVKWENGMLHPLKSVIFTAEYTKEKCDIHNCETCMQYACNFRNIERKKDKKMELRNKNIQKQGVYSYGISRIFGGEK